MPDVLMEGVRLMGRSAQLFLTSADASDIVTLADKMALIGCAGLAREDHRPVTMSAMEQLTTLTFNLLRSKDAHIRFAASKLKKNVSLVTNVALAIPDTPFTGRAYLAPYYSLTSEQTFGAWLTHLGNEIIKATSTDKAAQQVIANIETWSDELYRTEKELMLAAIEKKSTFTFEIIHWIAHVTKILVAVANAPACDKYRKEKISKHAAGLISVLSWVPDEREAMIHAESSRMTETLFEVALDALERGPDAVYRRRTKHWWHGPAREAGNARGGASLSGRCVVSRPLPCGKTSQRAPRA